MNAVRIDDTAPDRNVLDVDLRDVLEVLGPRAAASTWRAPDVWAIGYPADPFEALSEDAPIPGAELKRLADAARQVVDGVFTGYDPGADQPWIIVEAVDSTFYVVRSGDEAVLDAIRHAFRDVVPYSGPIVAPRW